MPHYKFDQIAFNITDKKMPEPGDEKMYIGLEHLDTGSLKITRWGSEVELKGQKLVMKKGDVLFGRRNTYLRRAALAPHDGIFSAHGMIFRPKTDVIDPDYFPFFISSNYFMDAAIRISVGSLSPTVNWKTLKELEFDIPTLEEQRKNAMLLKAINETKEAYQELLVQTDNLVKSQFIEMFGLPECNTHGYEIATISNVVKDVHYGTAKKASENGKYIYIRMNNITYDGELDLTDIKHIDVPEKELAGCIVQEGDVLFNRTNSKELVGKTCHFVGKEPMIIAGYIIRLRMNGKVLPEYLSVFMNLKRSKTLLYSMAKGAVGQANINATEVQSIPIIVPPQDVQQEFLKLYKQSDKSKFELKEAIKSCDALMKSILYTNLEEKEE